MGLLSSYGVPPSHHGGFSWCRAQALGHYHRPSVVLVVVALGLQSTGSVGVERRHSCSVTCGIFPDQGLNPCLLDWQVDSLPLSHQGSPAEWSCLMFCLVQLCMSADSIKTAFFFLTDEETEVQRCRTDKRV